jgi:hypothetical protein
MAGVRPIDQAAFWALRETRLHLLSDVEMGAFRSAMVPWLGYGDAAIREAALERLMMATFRMDYRPDGGRPQREREAIAHLEWLLGEIEGAHAIHDDVVPQFLRGLRYHGDSEPFRTPMLAWLAQRAPGLIAECDTGLLAGTALLIDGVGGNDFEAKFANWIVLLDDRSDYVRACAARLLGGTSDEDTVPTQAALFEIIGEKEIARPGVAGPFWSDRYHSPFDSVVIGNWMMNLLEQRSGDVPADLPTNDIDFYLHEICSHAPEMMMRMMRGGFDELAVMTATEMHERIEGVQPILEALARHEDARIAAAAKFHLANYYAGVG